MRLTWPMALAAILCVAPFAHAEKEGPAPQPEEQSEAWSPESAAQRLIAEARAEGVFVVAPLGDSIQEALAPEQRFARVLHPRSGLECSIGPHDRARLHVFLAEEGSFSAHGDDVSCDIATRFGNHTFYATRYPSPTTVEEQREGAIGQIMARWPDAAPLAIDESAAAARAFPGDEFLPRALSAQFQIDLEGRPALTRVTVAMIDGWVIKMRYTGAPGTDWRAEMVWLTTLRRIVRNRSV